MNVFKAHSSIMEDYESYIRSFLSIADPKILNAVEKEISNGKLWSKPLLQFNPSFKMAGSIDDIVRTEEMHPDLIRIFKGFHLYKHQVEAFSLGRAKKDFVVTSGTGSGKSLTYIGSIFNHILKKPESKGITAVIVYPMNALINSQHDALKDFERNYGENFPITYGKFTGQEDEDERNKMRQNPPHILLTNYMMLELLLTKIRERSIRDAIYENLKFLVFDELHTYRGRQGADVAMLIRRIRAKSKNATVCIGTSATMVSGGTSESQKASVVRVASQLFGKPFSVENIVTESLDYSLSSGDKSPSKQEIVASMKSDFDKEHSLEKLKQNAVAVWLENNVALKKDADGELKRGTPKTLEMIVSELSAESDLSVTECKEYIDKLLLYINGINQNLQKSGKKYTILPYKLHQFISQTGSVYSTLDQDENCHITLEPGVYKTDEKGNKPIFPVVFSRSSGHTFFCVRKTGELLEPREFKEYGGEDEEDLSEDGYLIIGNDVWNPSTDLENLPPSWLNNARNAPIGNKKQRFPQKIFFDEFGKCSQNQGGYKYWGWFMNAPLLFDPTSGSFFDTQTNESTKLLKLGIEGRSTSTTVITFSIINQLKEAGYLPNAQKLLSFTDNRQDAALQAGHFNNFVHTVLIRAAICRALENSTDGKLNFLSIGEKVSEALNLNFLSFANMDSVPQGDYIRKGFEKTFKKYLTYIAIEDLRRSWRIVLPNLEQCALLEIDYEYLPEICKDDSFWQNTQLFEEISKDERQELISNILDYFRHEYAIYDRSDMFLSDNARKTSEDEFRLKLKNPWTLDKKERLKDPYVLRYDPLARNIRIPSKSMGAASALGKFLKLYSQKKNIEISNYRDFIHSVMEKLANADLLKVSEAQGNNGQRVPIYQLNLDKIIWKKGNQNTVKPDVIKQRAYKERMSIPNKFFKALYLRDFSEVQNLTGEDHTGQLGTDIRIEREEKFKNGEISALFCSPTMELGVDIGDLSVVHLRNAPPNPANYAQRSGRAGRSGQGALVFTYCSSYAPHDRHYFKNQIDLVAGSVTPPKLDLCNKELLTTHLNSLVLSEVGLPGIEEANDRKASLINLVEESESWPLSASVKSGLNMSGKTIEELNAVFKKVIGDFMPELSEKGSGWFNDDWAKISLSGTLNHLDKSLKRWRDLYSIAKISLKRSTSKIDSGTLVAGSQEYKKEQRNMSQALRQINILKNELHRNTDLSEFYPFRYLASEGFLPGYNFPRLPLRIYLPTSDVSGDYVSRPRALALREFGPRNIIYYYGKKYRVCQLMIQDAESKLEKAVVSKKAGYFFPVTEGSPDTCPFSGESLTDNSRKIFYHDLLQMTESRGEEVERITCEEEERKSSGFEISTYFTIEENNFDKVQKASVYSSETKLLNMSYIPAARIVSINNKWRNQNQEGFPIGLTSGDWRTSLPGPDVSTNETFRLVKLYSSTVADALYLEPVQNLGLVREGVVTLQYSLKRAIEELFQVESNEIGVITIGDSETPNILFYESAEGSLGILSQLVNNIEIFNQLIEKAMNVCNFNDESYKEPASYNDLLSYYNQRDHKIIDRFLIKDALDKLKMCSVEQITNKSYSNYEEQYQSLIKAIDPTSSTEKKFLDYLYKNGLRLPDAAQKRVEGIYVQPDFYYSDRIWIFCDGTPHDRLEIQEDDRKKREAILARGDQVWVYNYKEILEEEIKKRPDIFWRVK